MVSFEEARNRILSSVSTIGSERIHLLDATGRILAKDMAAPRDLPLWDNSALDGYAVNSVDCLTAPHKLRVSSFLPAGANADGISVEQGCAVRIMAGAPIPQGCDTVVPIEETDNGYQEVTLLGSTRVGKHICFQGEDVAEGVTFARAGSLIRPSEVNMLASFGIAVIPVYRRPTVAILSTGNELVELGKTPGPNEIINSNTVSLATAVRETGAIPLIIGIAQDTHKSLQKKILEGLKADALITSAGVSAGDLDLVRDVLGTLGARQIFWKIGVKPGGQTAFLLHDRTPIFSLPGNPTSTLIAFEELVRPALLKIQGYRRVLRPLFKATLRSEILKEKGTVQILRIRLEREDGRWYASSSGNQQSEFLRTMVDAEAFAVLSEENTHFAAGDEVDVHFYGNRIDLV